MFKTNWKYSSLRFYILNTIWNYKFWLNAKKVFEVTTQTKKDRFGIIESTIVKKRFKGYLYRNELHLDNPGIPDIERDVWEAWKSKKLIN